MRERLRSRCLAALEFAVSHQLKRQPKGLGGNNFTDRADEMPIRRESPAGVRSFQLLNRAIDCSNGFWELYSHTGPHRHPPFGEDGPILFRSPVEIRKSVQISLATRCSARETIGHERAAALFLAAARREFA